MVLTRHGALSSRLLVAQQTKSSSEHRNRGSAARQLRTLMVARISFYWRCYERGRRRKQECAALLFQQRFRGRQHRRILVRELSARVIQYGVRKFLRRLASGRALLLSTSVVAVQRAFFNRQRQRCATLRKVAVEAAAVSEQRSSKLQEESSREQRRV